jgi:hypothetical protein
MGYIGTLEGTTIDREFSEGLSPKVFEWSEPEASAEEVATATVIPVSDFAPLRWSLKRASLSFSWCVYIESLPQGEATVQPIADIWDGPKLRKALMEPMGAPISLTTEEAIEIARRAFGSNPKLPSGKEFVGRIRPLIGHSILERLRRWHG